MVYELIVASLFFIIVAKPDNVGLRKIIYYVYMILMILGLIGYFIFVIIVFTSDWETDFCVDNYNDFNDFYDSLSDCEDWINTMMIVIVILSALIFIPCTLACLQVLYFGWKEQEALANQRGGGGAQTAPFNPHQ